MSFARARAARTLQTSLRSLRAGPARTQLPRLSQAGQRRWQSGGHGGDHGAASSDVPWIIGAVAVTVPGAWFLWPSPHSADAHHHDGEHEEHSEEAEGKEEDEAPQEESAPAEQADEEEKGGDDSDKEEKQERGDSENEKKEGGGDSGKEEKQEGGDSNKEEKKEGDSEDSGDKGGEGKSSNDSKEEKPEGDESKKSTYASNPNGKDAPQFNGKMKEGAEGQSDSRKSEHMPQSKQTNKKRVDSGYQKDLGSEEQYGDAATAKTLTSKAGGGGDIGSKQKGLSNTSTRHSTQLEDDPNKSKKGEGTPETAKSMGTIDPSRPAR